MNFNLPQKHHIFASESVSEGHPDKICDQISDAILDATLAQDPESRVACECLATTEYLVIAGEITSRAKVDCAAVARRVIRRIGYTSPELGFSADSVQIDVRLHEQSPNIAQGVDAATSRDREQGAGDQGLMFGYACDETDEFMPAPIHYAHGIVARLAAMRHEEPDRYPFLRPDAKSQVAIEYNEDNRPVAVRNLVVSHQHSHGAEALVREPALQAIREVIPEQLLRNLSEEDYYINATGSFERGGPYGDSGLTGRKIIVDTYGGSGRHGGGAFSGKDASKVDRSASYMARYAAKNIVAAGLARRCEIQVSYAIGISYPLSYQVETFGTARDGVTDRELTAMLAAGKVFDFRPAAIVDTLQLKTPSGWSYEQTASYGHFGRPFFPWERLDQVERLKSLFL